MNEFIEVTNRIITEKLKEKIKISSVDYYVLDMVLNIRVKYYTENFEKKAFRYSFYEVKFDKLILEQDFNCFIDGIFNL